MKISHIIRTLFLSLLFVILSFSFVGHAHAIWQLDPTFGTAGKVITSYGNYSDIESIALQSDGKIVAGGANSNGGHYNWALARYNTDGTLDTTFGTNGKVTKDFGYNNVIIKIGIQSDGKIVAIGTFSNTLWIVGRYNIDGTPDTSFGNDGITSIGVPLNVGQFDSQDLAIQADGKIVTTGYYNGATPLNADLIVIRQNTDGSLDTSFGNGGVVETKVSNFTNILGKKIALQADGKIIVDGELGNGGGSSLFVSRFNTDGSFDTSFGNNGSIVDQVANSVGVNIITIQPDGKIITGGESDIVPFIIRYNPDGSHDASFGSGGYVLNLGTNMRYPRSVLALTDGKIIIGGSDQNQNDTALASLNTDGTLDTTFGNNGFIDTLWQTQINNGFSQILIQTDGKILGGGFSWNGSFDDWILARFADIVPPPTSKDQCKDDGWKAFTNPVFKDQGECISFVNHKNH